MNKYRIILYIWTYKKVKNRKRWKQNLRNNRTSVTKLG